jgi:nitrogen-specific signal transduction histidine kinase/CheY-like chemotaxis protein
VYRGRPAAECLLIDTTETAELRERLNETEKLRSLGELAGGVAHDFNNLLSAILGRAQLLRRRGCEPAVECELAIIETAARDGRETVRRIQEFSRVRRDRRFDLIDLREILRDSAELTRPRWSAAGAGRGIELDLRVGTDGASRVAGNPAELRELFINLILNAVDAMPEGGGLSLSCRDEADSVIVEVADTGIGMTDTVRRHLFDPFFTTKGPAGMGLGLSMVYGIVARHDGTIDVRTAPGEGTTFSIAFPRKESMEGAAREPRQKKEETVPPARILVIDDEKEIAELLHDVLEIQGHTIRTAHTAAEGIRAGCSEEFDLIFTDLGLPDMSGWEVAARIREARPLVPIALVTGWAASIEESLVRERGLAALVHKPFEIEEVLRVTALILSARKTTTVAYSVE